jgi:maltose alpha-D-glucosyltransferase / alpha-amylase
VAARPKARRELERQPLWYKDGVIYQLHVRAFFDSDGDGVGDFRGLTQKLDYLRDLGVTALWLLPFYPSPLRDDGYDIADYTDVHESYGSLRDVEAFLREAHRRGLRVITELVLNHTSDQHPWFQRARRAKPGSKWRDFYVWSDSPKKYADARIIFKDFETSNWTWDPVAKAYFWHRFYSHQPDLNFESPAVRKAVADALDFWARLGVDGFRLDAVPYLYEREGTNCENLPETHVFLKSMRAHVDKNFHDRLFLAEANQWPEDAAAYFGNGDECHMAFHFPLMPRLFMAMHMEDRFPIVDILAQTPSIPESCQWAVFLRNHDELTLEMVTDEERDYMYRVYAQDPQARINLGIRRRLAPLVNNNRRRIELLNGLLCSMPGTPVIYYGDEIGMGDNIYLGDRNGVRTPMQWSADRNAGFSRADPQRLCLPVVVATEYHPEAVNVEQQQRNPHSLLLWMKRLIALRKRWTAFGRGTLDPLYPDNRKILAFVRSWKDERILVVANLSRFVQYAELDLAQFRGLVPVELFGGTEFPPVGELPYFLTLGPHAYYWFAFQAPAVPEVPHERAEGVLPTLTADGDWETVLEGPAKGALETALGSYVAGCRWFGSKARRMRSLTITDSVRVANSHDVTHVLLLRGAYVDGEPDVYVLPVTYAAGAAAQQLRERSPRAVIAQLGTESASDGILFDALYDRGFQLTLLDTIARRRRFRHGNDTLAGSTTRAFSNLRGPANATLEPTLFKGEQSNTSIVYGERLILKFFRRVQEGVNPDLEIGRFLTERVAFACTPPVAGALSYERPHGASSTFAILHGFVPNQGDAWTFTLDTLDQYFDRVLVHHGDAGTPPIPREPLTSLLASDPPTLAADTIGAYLESARILGRRTAELHLALAAAADDPDFAPEPFGSLYQRSMYQSFRSGAREAFELLRKQRRTLPERVRPDADRVLGLEADADKRFRTVITRKLTGMRIRFHGDYHLGQVLHTGKDFVILDFEGEPARSLTERRLRRSPLRDVAGMLRSFHYAAYTGLARHDARGGARPEDETRLEASARYWYHWVAVTFVGAYLETARDAQFVSRTTPELQLLLDVFMLEKALYELRYELNNRPEWTTLPLRGIIQLLETPPAET